jgi:hypothetical protein
LAVLLAALSVALAGCQALAEAGPLELGGDDGSLCIPVASGDSGFVGDVIEVPEGVDLTITGVRLASAQGMTLVGSYLLDVNGATVGSSLKAPTTPEWDDREDAVGASVASGEVKNLVLEVRRDSEGAASAAAMIVTYTVLGRSFEKSASTEYVLTDSCF